MWSWDDALLEYEVHLQQAELLSGTVAGYLRDMRSFADWIANKAGKDVAADRFTIKDVLAYADHLRHKLDRSPATVNRWLQSMRKFGRFAMSAGLRNSNPARDVPLLEEPATARPVVLNDLQSQRLVDAAAQQSSPKCLRDVAIVQLLLRSGIKASELVHLRLEHVDLAKTTSVVTVQARDGGRDRNVPLDRVATAALGRYLQEQRPEDAEHLFLSRDGSPLSIRSVQQIVAGLGKTIGLSISAKTLRDTFARRLWQNTGDFGLLVERLGHRRPESALKYVTPLRTTQPAAEVPEERLPVGQG
jgi:site-specific recombinase XerD